MLHISLEFSSLESLSKAQREAVAEFILAFPASEVAKDEADSDDVVSSQHLVRPQVMDAFDQSVDRNSDLLQRLISPEQAFSHPAASIIDNNVVISNHVDKYDKAGLPWDERIHASSHAKTADGSWRMKRGVDAGLVVQVEAELKALMAIPAPPAVERIETTVFPPFGVLSIPPPPTGTVHAAPAPALTVVPQAKHCDAHDAWYLTDCPNCAIPPVVIPPPPPSTVDFMGLLTFASLNIQAKKLSIAEVNEIVQAAGIPNLPMLQNRPDLVPAVHAVMTALIASR